LAVLAALACAAQAQPPEPTPPSGSAALDVVLVLDNSGSMRQNDPGFLMRLAMTSFASRLGPDARLALVSFDEKVHVLLDLTSTSDPDFQPRLASASLGLDYRGQRTDIPAGVERGLYALREQGRPDATRVLVLLTDGIVDVGNPAADVERARWLRETLAAEAHESGVRIFGIAFTDQADYQLLQSLAHETNGGYFRAGTAAELESVLDRLRARLAEPPPIPSVSPPGAGEVPPPAGWRSMLQDWRVWAVAGLVLLLLFTVGTVGLVLVARGRRPASTAASPGAVHAATLRDLGGYSQAEMHPLDRTVFRIGRIAGVNDLVLPYDSVTKQHALVEFRDGCFRLRDLRSTNGTYVNGERLGEKDWVLKHGDIVAFHRCEFEFIVDELWEESATTFMERPVG